MNQQPSICVLGAGAWGTALAVHLARNGSCPIMWGYLDEDVQAMQRDRENKRYLPGVHFPNSLSITSSLEEAIRGQDEILVVVPSEAFRETLQKIKPLLSASANLVWATKGLESRTGQFLHEVVTEELGTHIPRAVISGPSFAAELGQGQPTAIAVASDQPQLIEKVTARFHRGSLRLYANDDLVGVQLGGAVKNVMAVAAGISDGLGFGCNARAALITRGLAEMVRLGEKLGAQRETLMGLAGLGDLVLTCTDNLSRNKRFGFALGQGKNAETAQREIKQVVEGAITAKVVNQVASTHEVELPICSLVYQILYRDLPPSEAVDALLNRNPTSEFKRQG